jgi:hypothetical protein
VNCQQRLDPPQGFKQARTLFFLFFDQSLQPEGHLCRQPTPLTATCSSSSPSHKAPQLQIRDPAAMSDSDSEISDQFDGLHQADEEWEEWAGG